MHAPTGMPVLSWLTQLASGRARAPGVMPVRGAHCAQVPLFQLSGPVSARVGPPFRALFNHDMAVTASGRCQWRRLPAHEPPHGHGGASK
jgi:hypothetical protein